MVPSNPRRQFLFLKIANFEFSRDKSSMKIDNDEILQILPVNSQRRSVAIFISFRLPSKDSFFLVPFLDTSSIDLSTQKIKINIHELLLYDKVGLLLYNVVL